MRIRRIWIVAVSAAIVSLAPSFASAERPNQLSARQRPLTRIAATNPVDGAIGIALDSIVDIEFTDLIDPNSVGVGSIGVSVAGTPVTTQRTVSLDRRHVLLAFPEFLPGNSTIDVVIDGSVLRDITGRYVDADGDGIAGGIAFISFTTNAPLPPPVLTDTAIITGYVSVIEPTTGLVVPLPNATARAYLYPASPGAPVHGMAMTDANGFFQLETDPFTGTETFLVAINYTGFSEALRQVTILASRCQRVDDAVLQQLGPVTMIPAASGGTATDLDQQVELEIPGGALGSDSLLQVTRLDGAEQLRDHLPTFTSTQGTFIDITGVSGETTAEPVTLRIPNLYGL
ncbi:MAG: Ig-like domain-containing protein, partial [Planctomycetes bacterium]|nr:Ig-like domain-containing protein [Planctomycetota bacterium]